MVTTGIIAYCTNQLKLMTLNLHTGTLIYIFFKSLKLKQFFDAACELHTSLFLLTFFFLNPCHIKDADGFRCLYLTSYSTETKLSECVGVGVVEFCTDVLRMVCDLTLACDALEQICLI